MSESSILWTTDGTGDGAADITQAQWISFFSMLFLSDSTTEGVAPRYLNALAVSSTGNNNARVATGGAVVRGFLYRSTANVDTTITSPAADTGFRVVLRADWTLQTVRVAVRMNTTGVTDAPALVQVDGTTWEISLGTGVISSAGVISSLVSAPTYMHYNTNVSTAMLEADSVTNAKIGDDAVDTAQLADNSVTSAQIAADAVGTSEIAALAVGTAEIAEDAVTKAKLANVYPDLIGRQGTNVSNWANPGVDNFGVTQVEMQLGSIEIIMASPNDGTTVAITFPEEFLGEPSISLTIQKMVVTGTGTVRGGYVTCTVGPTTTGMTIALWRRDPSDTSGDLTAQIHWQAWSGNNS